MNDTNDGMTTASQTETGAPRGGPVMLDIGGDIGALILTLPDSLADTEIHISPAGVDGPTAEHTGVHPRTLGGRTRQVAVFPSLTAGAYQLWHPHDASFLTDAHIDGGKVTSIDLSESTSARPSGGDHHHGHSHPHDDHSVHVH